MMGAGGLAMILWPSLLVLLLLGGLAALLVWFEQYHRRADRQRSAREILDQRFALGEIDEQAYRSRRKQLRRSNA
jgi:putative membrane protein